MDIARTGHGCAVGRATALAELAPAAVRSGPGWLAVRSGAASNDLNLVVSEPGFVPDPQLLDRLLDWFEPLPASWLVREPDDSLTHTLVVAGWMSERTGRWCGRTFSSLPCLPSVTESVTVQAVTDDDGLDAWLDIAAACEWVETAEDRRLRGELLRAAARDRRWAAWVARLEGRPVGMARGWSNGPHIELVDVAVRHEARRHGLGTALVSSALAWGAARGASEVVAAPSPDGWLLFEALGFHNVPVDRDVCFYTTDAKRGRT